MPNREKLKGIFINKKLIVKNFMKIISDKRIGIVHNSIQESSFSDKKKFEKICDVLSAIYCDKSSLELLKSEVDDLIHELSTPSAKVFATKYKVGKKIGRELKADLVDKVGRIFALGFERKELFQILKKVNKFQKVAGGDESVMEDEKDRS